MVEHQDRDAPGGISIHAIDVANGVPAKGLSVRLFHFDDGRVPIAEGQCSAQGLLVHPIAQGKGVVRGLYEVEFDVGNFYRNKMVEIPKPAFLETAVFRFGIDRILEHFHLPLKFTPWGFSLFRGGE